MFTSQISFPLSLPRCVRIGTSLPDRTRILSILASPHQYLVNKARSSTCRLRASYGCRRPVERRDSWRRSICGRTFTEWRGPPCYVCASNRDWSAGDSPSMRAGCLQGGDCERPSTCFLYPCLPPLGGDFSGRRRSVRNNAVLGRPRPARMDSPA